MKAIRAVFLILIIFIMAMGICLAQKPDVMMLSKGWAIKSAAEVKEKGDILSTPQFKPDAWYPASIPSTVLAALVEAKVYPDPYYGANLKSTPGYKAGRWLVIPKDSPFKSPWWFRTEFVAPAAYKGKNLTLHLDGINYQANVWINGKKIADSQSVIGMFRRFEIAVNDSLKPGEKNCLAVEVIPPGLIPDKAYTTKQMEATTGWDDHNPQPPDMNLGIWQNVYIKATGPVALKNPHVVTRVDLPSLEAAHLTITAELKNQENREIAGELQGAIEKIMFSQKVKLAAGETKLVTFSPDEFKQLNISKPRLWWPNLVGTPELYDLRLTFTANGVASDGADIRFGIREATTYINDEGWRGYMINGRKILIRGGAWMTSDMLLRLTPKRYEALVRYAKEANLNMLRSEGFSIRETDEFYSLCDKYGIMVTQQIFGRSIPDEVLAIKVTEDTLLRIRNHPSLVHFLGHDETFPTPTLDKAYKDLVAKLTPERTYQPHSGAFDVNERFQTGGTRTGTRELWTYATPSIYYTGKNDGAWGFAQSGGIGGVITPIESMRKMMPEKDMWPLWSEAASLHTVIQGGTYFDALVKALDTRYGKATGIEDFCRKGQLMNYESARGMFEAYGRNKYAATGITTWKYDAAWPAWMTWQYVDWYLRVGGAYYAAKKACEPIHVQYSYDDHSIWVVNALYRDLKDLKVSARLLDFDLKERFSKTAAINAAPDSSQRTFTIERPSGLTTTFFLQLKLQDAAGKTLSDNLYWLSTVPDVPGPRTERGEAYSSKPKSVADLTALNKLPQANVTQTSRFEKKGAETVGYVTVENASDKLALALRLLVSKGKEGEEILPSYWDDNYFSLLPGEKRTVNVRFATAELGAALPVVSIDGWNATKK
jgi:exo-1,4-beta-D-glucosaminidase